ncbi:IS110 family transposase [Rhizobium mesoamericanum]|uniref:Transposase n=1 Tax=Rhizobium mesoamericanum STM3625 TaxID=1211777 RepID=K0PS17_9HYPH|nr:IS110 family transposase [Rhizobium mesoamericanum]CCM73987.1 transposase [Rhizobium mesoamericanum STM3625]
MEIYVGIDIAKETHWACALDARAQVLLDRAVDNDQAAIEHLVADLHGLGGEVVVGLDITGSLARFLEGILLAKGLRLVHAPGIAVNRAGQGFSGGERKSDPRDAHTIAELVRTRDLRPILPDDETAIALRLKVTRRRELSDDQTRRISRMRQLLGAIHPGLERRLDLTAKGPLVLVTRYVTPAEIRRAGLKRIMAHLKRIPHLHAVEALAQRALEAAEGQSIAVPGEASFADMVRELAAEALQAREAIARIDRDLEALLERHPDGALIRSLPGMGAVLSAELIANIGTIERFHSADAMASAAGLTPVIRQSGKSRNWRRALGGDKALKRVFFQSAFCAVSTRDPLSKAFYDRKRREGKHHTQAIIALARRRVTVLWTMLRTRQTFDPTQKAA